jgi:hypothetical protein
VNSVLNAFDVSKQKKGFVPKAEPNPILSTLHSFLTTLGYKLKEFGFNENTYRLWYNLLILNMLLIIVKNLSCNEESEESEEDTVVEMNNLRTELISRLDPYLRIQSTKKRYNYNTEHIHGVRYGI